MKGVLAALMAVAACAPAAPPTNPPVNAPPPDLRLAPASPAESRAIELHGDFRQAGFARGRLPTGSRALTLDGTPVPVAADGGFFIAFGRDAPAEAVVRAIYADGSAASRSLVIAPRAFPEQHLPAALNRPFASDPDFERRRAVERERISAARAAPSRAEGWRQRFIWPVKGSVSGVFGSQRFYGDAPESPHSGIDIAVPAGTPVRAPASGRVVLASPPQYSLEGNLVILDHGLGLYSALLHLSRVDVTVGSRVEAGDIIGAVGATGRATGPHLHWGVMWQGVRFDPAQLVEESRFNNESPAGQIHH